MIVLSCCLDSQTEGSAKSKFNSGSGGGHCSINIYCRCVIRTAYGSNHCLYYSFSLLFVSPTGLPPLNHQLILGKGSSREIRLSREGSSREGSSREGRIREGSSGEGSSREGSSGDNGEGNNSGEGSSREGSSGEGNSGEGNIREGSSTEGSNGEGSSGEGNSGEGSSRESSSREGSSREGSSREVSSCCRDWTSSCCKSGN